MMINITTIICLIPIILFFSGSLLLLLNSSNLLLVILYLELLIISCFTNFLFLAKLTLITNNYAYSFLLLAVAASETALGLILIIQIFGFSTVLISRVTNIFKH
jgi:NADH-quinone oxidoreductase subunit K